MRSQLSKVYFDGRPVTLMGDEARPPLSRIVRAGGKVPGSVEVVRLESRSGRSGPALGPGDIIDRTAEPTKPIYLRSVARPVANPAATAAAGLPLAPPTSGQATPVLPFLSNADPVVAQLGADPLPARSQPTETRPQPAARRPPFAPLGPNPSLDAKRAKAQAEAEAEAEQRQEEQREGEDILQDEEEAFAEAEEDS